MIGISYWQEKKQNVAKVQKLVQTADTKEDSKEERVITLRPLNMEDFKQAHNQVMHDICVALEII